MAIPRQAVDQQQHALPAIAEMLRRRHRRLHRFGAHQRGRIRGGHEHQRALAPIRPQIIFQEFPYLAPALTHQSHHDNIERRPSRQHAEQRGFPHPRPGETPHPLPQPAGGEQVHRPHPQRDRRPHPRPRGRRRRGPPDRLWLAQWQCPAAVQRLTQRIDHAADPTRPDRQRRHARAERQAGRGSGPKPRRIAKQRDRGVLRRAAGHLRRHRRPIAPDHLQPIADRQHPRQRRQNGPHPGGRGHPGLYMLGRKPPDRMGGARKALGNGGCFMDIWLHHMRSLDRIDYPVATTGGRNRCP